MKTAAGKNLEKWTVCELEGKYSTQKQNENSILDHYTSRLYVYFQIMHVMHCIEDSFCVTVS